MMTFIATVEQMAAQLRDLQSPISELQMMAKILMSLPATFRHFVSAWDSVPTQEKTLNLLTTRLIKEEKMNKIYNESEPVALSTPDAAYLAGNSNGNVNYFQQQHGFRGTYSRGRGGIRGRGSFRGNRGGNRSWVVCHYCNIPGHIIANCRKRMRDEKPTETNMKSENVDFVYSSEINALEKR